LSHQCDLNHNISTTESACQHAALRSDAVNRKSHVRFTAPLLGFAALAALSCRSGETTAPAKIGPLPPDSTPHLTITLPAGQKMTAGTTERIALAAVNIKPRSCVVSAAQWVGLAGGADSNSTWTMQPSAAGTATLSTRCSDYRNDAVLSTDTVQVYPKPTVDPGISGIVPVAVGDSIDVSYDSTDTPKIDVSCTQCAGYAQLTRVASNTLRVFAQLAPKDTTRPVVCFSAHGFDGRYVDQECLILAIVPAQLATYSVPSAIRSSEVVALHSIPVATYDKTGQSNHPDFQRVSAPWSGGACWMVFTPYFGSNGFVENPSLATSPDCEHWTPAAGVKAPLVDKPTDGYNSDPELVYDKAHGCLGVVFRQVTGKNIIDLTGTCDGKTWSAPRTLFTAPNHSAVSPTVALGPDGFDRIFYVDAGLQGCTSQNNVVKMRTATALADSVSLDKLAFGGEVVTDLAQPGFVIWHIKVRYVTALQQYIAMYAAFPLTTGIGDCTDDDLFMATSADGIHWHPFQAPMLNHLDRRFDFTTLYRASFQYDGNTDQLRTIVSGLEKAGWGQFGVVHQYASLVNALNSSYTVAASQLVPSPVLVRKPAIGAKKVMMEDRP
jgi:hypothetical protein